MNQYPELGEANPGGLGACPQKTGSGLGSQGLQHASVDISVGSIKRQYNEQWPSHVLVQLTLSEFADGLHSNTCQYNLDNSSHIQNVTCA
ncbi:hypothetical protein TRICI_005259 [Trichomonascus ciferrii]|uniref:Uncharacterized protein n=1 Tax=Trichomonascus ciferrii TaxID=44093 RepID=A0A642UUQ8_9ASCO|nr:hypothetical protein TRICI_005259 [Trichomonascus ciferrii]